jgi:hypothetical protein
MPDRSIFLVILARMLCCLQQWYVVNLAKISNRIAEGSDALEMRAVVAQMLCWLKLSAGFSSAFSSCACLVYESIHDVFESLPAAFQTSTKVLKNCFPVDKLGNIEMPCLAALSNVAISRGIDNQWWAGYGLVPWFLTFQSGLNLI